MSIQFFQTGMGRKFFESDIPQIINALTKIADGIETRTIRVRAVSERSPNIRCDNCGRKFLVSQIVPLEEVKYLADRIDPGSVVPVGECRECSALCYYEDDLLPLDIMREAYAALNTAPRFQVPSKGTDSYAIAHRLGVLLGEETRRRKP